MRQKSGASGAKQGCLKDVQRRLYDLLLTRWGTLCFGLFVLLSVRFSLNTTISVLQTVPFLKPTCHACETDFSNNLHQHSFESRMCSPPSIDIVYTWVNGSDPLLQAHLEYFRLLQTMQAEGLVNGTLNSTNLVNVTRLLNATSTHAAPFNMSHASSSSTGNETLADYSDEVNSSQEKEADDSGHEHARFRDNNELLYSLRSVWQFAPWVRHVFIVTNGQVPHWLDTDHPRITIVTHADLFPNTTHLPVFSSPAIEAHLHRIPGLSEKFIYLNDDVMFGNEVWPEDFYTHSKGQKVYLSWPVPSCSDGCMESWVGDGYCDNNCNTLACNWDEGDCKKVNGTVQHRYDEWQWDRSDRSSYNSQQTSSCANQCPTSWVGDRVCDVSCNVVSCGFDGADCGVEKMPGTMPQIYLHNLTTTVYALPNDTYTLYVNFSSVFPHGILEASHNNEVLVRSAVISQPNHVLVLLLLPYQEPEEGETGETGLIVGDTVFRTLEITFTPKPAPRNSSSSSSSSSSAQLNHTIDVPSVFVFNLTLLENLVPLEPEDEVEDDDSNTHVGNATVISNAHSLIHQPDKLDSSNNTSSNTNHTAVSSKDASKSSANQADSKGKKQPRRHLLDTSSPTVQTSIIRQTRAAKQFAATPSYIPSSASCMELYWQLQPSEEKVGGLAGFPSRVIGVPPARVHNHGLEDSFFSGESSGMNSRGLSERGVLQEKEMEDADNVLAQWIASSKSKELYMQSLLDCVQLIEIENRNALQSKHGDEEEEGEEEGNDFENFQTKREERRRKEARGGVALNKAAGNRWPWELSLSSASRLASSSFSATNTKTAAVVTFFSSSSSLTSGHSAGGRILLDFFGDSLRHVNLLLSKRFGHASRKVPAHMPHFIDKNIMTDLQAIWPEHYEATSSHRFRHSSDMQFAFAYFYYLMHARKTFQAEEYWSSNLDLDRDNILNDLEVRHLALLLHPMPESPRVNDHDWKYLRTELRNCTLVSQGLPAFKPLANGTELPFKETESSSSFAPNVYGRHLKAEGTLLEDRDEVHITATEPEVAITFEGFAGCERIMHDLNKTVSKQSRYPFHIDTQLNDVEFYMVGDKYKDVALRLGKIAAKEPKFICLNDNMSKSATVDPKLVHVLQDFYRNYYPDPSPFELPAGQENPSLYMHQGLFLFDIEAINASAIVESAAALAASKAFSNDTVQGKQTGHARAMMNGTLSGSLEKQKEKDSQSKKVDAFDEKHSKHAEYGGGHELHSHRQSMQMEGGDMAAASPLVQWLHDWRDSAYLFFYHSHASSSESFTASFPLASMRRSSSVAVPSFRLSKTKLKSHLPPSLIRLLDVHNLPFILGIVLFIFILVLTYLEISPYLEDKAATLLEKRKRKKQEKKMSRRALSDDKNDEGEDEDKGSGDEEEEKVDDNSFNAMPRLAGNMRHRAKNNSKTGGRGNENKKRPSPSPSSSDDDDDDDMFADSKSSGDHHGNTEQEIRRKREETEKETQAIDNGGEPPKRRSHNARHMCNMV